MSYFEVIADEIVNASREFIAAATLGYQPVCRNSITGIVISMIRRSSRTL